MNFSWQNVIEGHGIGITLTGMCIVFSGLALISLFITRLPNLLALGDRLFKSKSAAPSPVRKIEPTAPTESEIMAALALVLHLELERTAGDRQRITISRKQRQGSVWNSAGKMRSLSEGGPHA